MNNYMRIGWRACVSGVVAAVGVAALSAADARAQIQPDALSRAAVWVSTDDGLIGVYGAAAPFTQRATLAAPGDATVIKRFKNEALLLGRDTGRVQFVNAWSLAVRADVQLPEGWGIVDGVAATSNIVWLTREGDARVWKLDIEAAEVTAGADLGIFAPTGGGVVVNRMIVVGKRVYVQVQRVAGGGESAAGGGGEAAGEPHGVLAVLAMDTGALLDVDPTTPVIDPIALAGPRPVWDMMPLQKDRFLLVCVPGGQHDEVGGYDLVDLWSAQSLGFVVSESGPNSYAHLGGFVVNHQGQGILVFHTDLLPSAHLQRFTVIGGPSQPPGIYDSLQMTSDEWAVSSSGKMGFFADRGKSTVYPNDPEGLHVWNLATGQRLTDHAVPTPGLPFDIAAFD